MTDISYWKALVFPRDLAEFSSEAGDAAFFASYPAELADEMVEGIARLRGQEQKPAILLLSPLVNSPSWWRLFHSLLPNCPINAEPFLRLAALWHVGNGENDERAGRRFSKSPEELIDFRKRVEDAAKEVAFFGMWLEATGLWEQRPDEKESSIRREQKQILNEIIAMNPGLKAKGEPDSVMKRFRTACRERGLSGINESKGLAMIRECHGQQTGDQFAP
jgi:hypothetical protein